MALDGIGSGAIGHPVSRMGGLRSLKTLDAYMHDIRQRNDNNDINRSNLRIRPAKKYEFVPLPPTPNLRSRSGAFTSLSLGTPVMSSMALDVGGRSNSARFRMRRHAAGASEAAFTATLAIEATAGPADSQPHTETVALASDWHETIDWGAFDKADVNMTRQGNFDNFETVYGWLQSDVQVDKLPLDIAQFAPAELERFHANAMSSMGYAVLSGRRTDPAFLQYLLVDFFLHNAAPFLQGSGDNHGIPFTRNLLLAMRRSTTRDPGECGSDGGRAMPLRRVAELKADLRDRFLLDNQMFYPGPGSQRDLKLAWIFESMCQLAEPTLVRRDLPDDFRYGSLEWVLLSLGMHLAGDTHRQLRDQDLIMLAIASDIRKLFTDTTGESTNVNEATPQKMAMRLVLLMAHAHGKLDLLQPVLTREHIDLAIALFDEKWSALMEKSEPLERYMQRLPKRSEVAREMMQENGFDAIEQCFRTGIRSRQAIPNLRNLPTLCTPIGKRHRMHEVLMMDCLGRNEFGDQLSPQQKIQLASPALSYIKLAARFKQKFDAALLPLSREIMLPLLAQRIKQMDVEDARFWNDGAWTVRVPKVRLQSKTKVSQYVGQFSAGQGHEMYGSYKMKGVLVQITIDQDSQPESRHYWATFHPFELCRYHESDMALLDSDVERFFQTGKIGLQPSIAPYSIRYEVRSKDNSEDNLLQSVTALLLRPYVPDLFDYATEVTQAEKTRISRLESRLNLIPFRSSIKALQAGELGFSTHLNILFDLASLVPLFSAGANLAKAGIGIGKSMTAGQIGNAARAAMIGRVHKLNAMRIVPMVSNIGKPAAGLAIEGIRLLDIGLEMSFRLMTRTPRLSAADMDTLKQKFDGIRQLEPLAAMLERALQSVQKPYRWELGFWRTQADFDTRAVGGIQPHLDLGGIDYPIFAVGDIGNAIAIREGAGFRLVNPDSGLGYGPLMRQANVVGKLELATLPVGSRRNLPMHGIAHGPLPKVTANALCRVRRANGNVPPCVKPDSWIDNRILYYWTGFASDQVYQLPLLAPVGRELRIGRFLVDAGKRRFSIAGFPASHAPINDMVPQLTGQSLLSRSRPVLSEDSDAWLVSTVNKYGDAVNHLEMSTTDSGGSIVTTFYMPFGTYEALALNPLEWKNVKYKDIKIEVVGIVYLVPGDPATAYRFSFDKSRIPLRVDAPIKVKLQVASALDLNKYSKFQTLIRITQENYATVTTHAFNLENAELALQDKFAAVFQRTDTLLAQAQYVFTSNPILVRRICIKMLNLPVSPENSRKISRVIEAAHLQVTRMQRLMPELQRQSGHFIGFFADATNNLVRAAAIPFSLADNLDLSAMDNPLVIFESNYFLRQDVALDNHGATLVHELSHALFGTEDGMVPFGPGVYAHSNDVNQFAMTAISAAAASPESRPENHAPTLEHLTILVAYAAAKNKHKLDIFLSETQVPGQAVYDRFWKYGQGNKVKAGTGGLPRRCRNQRAIGASVMCSMVPEHDGRFGWNGYSRPDAPDQDAFQWQVTGPSTVFKKINLADAGFNTWRTDAQSSGALTYAAPAQRHGPERDSWKEAGDLAVLYGAPSQIKIMRLPNKKRNGQTEYALLEFTNGLIKHTRYLPFSSYQDADGVWINLIALGAEKYFFKTNGERIGIGSQVALAAAGASERGKLHQYQELLNSAWPAPEVIPADLVRLDACSPGFQDKFRFLLSRTQTILDDAVVAMEREPALFDAICRRFSSPAYSAEIMAPDLARSLRTMRDRFDYFKRQCVNVIGFCRSPPGVPNINGRRSQAYPHAMEVEIDFSHINKTLIYFDAQDFDSTVQFDDRQAALLLYDYARILLGLNDHAVGPGLASLYADSHEASIDVASQITALHASGNSPAAYAFTAQHAAMLLAYGWSPAKRPYIKPFFSIGRDLQENGVHASEHEIIFEFPVSSEALPK